MQPSWMLHGQAAASVPWKVMPAHAQRPSSPGMNRTEAPSSQSSTTDRTEASNVKLSLPRLGLEPSDTYRVTDLWSGDSHDAQGALDAQLKPAESTILHLVRK